MQTIKIKILNDVYAVFTPKSKNLHTCVLENSTAPLYQQNNQTNI